MSAPQRPSGYEQDVTRDIAPRPTLHTAAPGASVGNTRMHELAMLMPALSARLFAKCEFENPTGSHKDRVFNHIIDVLEARGEIHAGMTLIDCSTGNGGAALAAAGRARGYQVVVVMPAGMTTERKAQIRSLGGEIVETAPDGFLDDSEEWAKDYAREHRNAYYLDQSSNRLNREAWRRCGEEIVTFFDQHDLQVDAFVCSIGTGGTFSGIAEVLKARYPALRTVAIEVDRSAPLFAKRTGIPFVHRSHNLMGLGPGKIAKNLREDLVDEVRTVSGDDGWQMMKRLGAVEGLQVGPTAGSNVLTAIDVAADLGPDQIVATVLFDSAWKYHSIWDGRYAIYGDGR
jgi:cysteine synthase